MNKKYTVVLSEAERVELESTVNTGRNQARVIKRARALLLSHQGKRNTETATACGITPVTMTHLCRRFVEGGLQKALYDAPRPGAAQKFGADDEARITAIACSQAPDGRSRWTLRLLAARIVELDIAENVAPATVRKVLKKTNFSRTKRNSGASAPLRQNT